MIKQHMQGCWKALLAQRGTQSTAFWPVNRRGSHSVLLLLWKREVAEVQPLPSRANVPFELVLMIASFIYFSHAAGTMLKTQRRENAVLVNNSGKSESHPKPASSKKKAQTPAAPKYQNYKKICICVIRVFLCVALILINNKKWSKIKIFDSKLCRTWKRLNLQTLMHFSSA